MGLRMLFRSRNLDKISSFLFTIATSISALLTIFSDNFVPEQFTRDSKYIQARMESSVTGYHDSFQIMVDFYSWMGFNRPSPYLRLFEWCVFFLVLIIARSKIKQYRHNFLLTLIGSFYLLLVPFYGSLFTKEIFMSILLMVFLLLRKKEDKRIFLKYSFLILLFAITIRNYYFITLMFFCLYCLKDLKLRKSAWDLLLPVSILSIFSTIDHLGSFSTKLTGSDIFAIRLDTQSGFRIQVNSLIRQESLGTNVLENFLNYTRVLLEFLLPWKILEFSAYSIVVFIIVFTLVILIIYPYMTRATANSFDAIFLWSYFSVSLIFEPDLGSFVRHTFPFIPIVILAISSRIYQAGMSQKVSRDRGMKL